MTECEWLTCVDPNLMLVELSGRVSARKLRLFAAACCRHIWHLLPDQRSRTAVEVAERYADGLAGKRALAAAKAAAAGVRTLGASAAYWAVSQNLPGAIRVLCIAAVEAIERWAVDAAYQAGADQMSAWDAARARGTHEQARSLREILGNPFRPSLERSGWLDWRGGLIRSMAGQIYESGDFHELPVLADALEDAGCMDRDVLSHCRNGGDHLRGCWALDLLLGKE
jgi:hypothetical protein